MNLIVMLTQNDYTINNAYEVFKKCKNSNIEYWGIKDKPLKSKEIKRLFSYMKKNGKKTVLEVVAYSEIEGIKGAKLAKKCNCDILIGTKYYDSIDEICKKNNIKYMPYVGEINGRPSILNGKISEIINESKTLVNKGIYGINLLSYRFTGDSSYLNEEMIKNIKIPICIAGDINSYKKLEELKKIQPYFITIGGAFIEKKFGEDMLYQIEKINKYIHETKEEEC